MGCGLGIYVRKSVALCSLVVEGEEVGEDLLIGQVRWPAVGGQDGSQSSWADEWRTPKK